MYTVCFAMAAVHAWPLLWDFNMISLQPDILPCMQHILGRCCQIATIIHAHANLPWPLKTSRQLQCFVTHGKRMYAQYMCFRTFCEHVATMLTACIKDWCQTKHAWAEKHLRQVRCHGTVGRGGHDGRCGCPSCMANPDDHTWAVYFVEVVLTFGYLGMHIWSSKKINELPFMHAIQHCKLMHACMHMYYFNHAIHGAWFDGATSGGQSCPEGGVWISHL